MHQAHLEAISCHPLTLKGGLLLQVGIGSLCLFSPRGKALAPCCMFRDTLLLNMWGATQLWIVQHAPRTLQVRDRVRWANTGENWYKSYQETDPTTLWFAPYGVFSDDPLLYWHLWVGQLHARSFPLGLVRPVGSSEATSAISRVFQRGWIWLGEVCCRFILLLFLHLFWIETCIPI